MFKKLIKNIFNLKPEKGHEEKPLFVPPGHFYSPIVDTDAIEYLFDNSEKKEIKGITIEEDEQLNLWGKFLPHLKHFPFSEEKKEGFRYYCKNQAYGIGDASIYFAMLLEYSPKKIIEIGSGFSSACALDVVEKYFNHDVEFAFIEPFPELLNSLINADDRNLTKIYSSNVQDVDVDIFQALGKNDFLFIDSTHVIKTCSDVHFELFDILPNLKKGVIVHFHDVFWPFEYPRYWAINENRSWNELYALRAFLMYQDTFKIKFFNDFFAKRFAEKIRSEYPNFLKNPGGGLWLQKTI